RRVRKRNSESAHGVNYRRAPGHLGRSGRGSVRAAWARPASELATVLGWADAMEARLAPILALGLALAGCSAPDQGKTPAVRALAPGTPFGIAADATGVYWASAFGGEERGAVRKLGPGAKKPQILATGLSNPFDVALDAKSVYWTELGDADGDGAVKSVA